MCPYGAFSFCSVVSGGSTAPGRLCGGWQRRQWMYHCSVLRIISIRKSCEKEKEKERERERERGNDGSTHVDNETDS